MDSKQTGQDQDDNGSVLGSEGESLEFGGQPETTVISPTNGSDGPPSEGGGSVITPGGNSSPSGGSPQGPHGSRWRNIWDRLNIYLLLFILIIIISLTIVAVLYFKNHGDKTTPAAGTITQQKLSSDALEQLATNGVQIGDPKQVLSVQSNSVFAGTVLVKGELQVAGGLKIGSGGLAIPDVNVGGTALINQLQTKSLAVAGNTSILGQLVVQQNVSVNGTGTFNGAISTPRLNAGTLQISGDLSITRHLVAGGSIPKRTNGSLGNGGTSSNSGSDTAGSISINTGSNTTPGCLVTITFAQGFNATPHIALTPVGAAAAGLTYYITRTTSSFSVCSNNAPPANETFGFDYLALD